jgi:Ras-related protein Rab-32
VSSYQAVKKWKDDIDSKVTLADGGRIPVLLLANKVIDSIF